MDGNAVSYKVNESVSRDTIGSKSCNTRYLGGSRGDDGKRVATRISLCHICVVDTALFYLCGMEYVFARSRFVTFNYLALALHEFALTADRTAQKRALKND